jgi:hypothetical protein
VSPPAPATPAPPRPAAPIAGRPVNPFLSQDPAQKARRLARALVSDIVVYHPAKRQEGLRDGTLKELFEEEIRKSYEEFTDQVGRELAESTGYFREALNEILAGGRQIFWPPMLAGRRTGRPGPSARPGVRATIIPSSSAWSAYMAELVERLTELQDRVSELRDFL